MRLACEQRGSHTWTYNVIYIGAKGDNVIYMVIVRNLWVHVERSKGFAMDLCTMCGVCITYGGF